MCMKVNINRQARTRNGGKCFSRDLRNSLSEKSVKNTDDLGGIRKFF